MDDTRVACSLTGEFWLNNPITSAGVWFVACRVPMHQGTRVVDIVVRKPKEEVNPCDKEPSHPDTLGVSHIDENTVPAWARDVAHGPERCRANDLPVHSSGARRIARCAKCRCGGVVDRHFCPPNHRAHGKCQFIRPNSRCGINLVEQEAAHEVQEVMLSNLHTECRK